VVHLSRTTPRYSWRRRGTTSSPRSASRFPPAVGLHQPDDDVDPSSFRRCLPGASGTFSDAGAVPEVDLQPSAPARGSIGGRCRPALPAYVHILPSSDRFSVRTFTLVPQELKVLPSVCASTFARTSFSRCRALRDASRLQQGVPDADVGSSPLAEDVTASAGTGYRRRGRFLPGNRQPAASRPRSVFSTSVRGSSPGMNRVVPLSRRRGRGGNRPARKSLRDQRRATTFR